MDIWHPWHPLVPCPVGSPYARRNTPNIISQAANVNLYTIGSQTTYFTYKTCIKQKLYFRKYNDYNDMLEKELSFHRRLNKQTNKQILLYANASSADVAWKKHTCLCFMLPIEKIHVKRNARFYLLFFWLAMSWIWKRRTGVNLRLPQLKIQSPKILKNHFNFGHFCSPSINTKW